MTYSISSSEVGRKLIRASMLHSIARNGNPIRDTSEFSHNLPEENRKLDLPVKIATSLSLCYVSLIRWMISFRKIFVPVSIFTFNRGRLIGINIRNINIIKIIGIINIILSSTTIITTTGFNININNFKIF